MSQELYSMLEETHDFQVFNRHQGLEITEDRTPEASYVLPQGEMNLYSYSPSFKDTVHPFRPSGSVIAEVFLSSGDEKIAMYLSGSPSQFESLDEELLDILDSEASPEYYKKIL